MFAENGADPWDPVLAVTIVEGINSTLGWDRVTAIEFGNGTRVHESPLLPLKLLFTSKSNLFQLEH